MWIHIAKNAKRIYREEMIGKHLITLNIGYDKLLPGAVNLINQFIKTAVDLNDGIQLN